MIDIKITLPSHGKNLSLENFYTNNLSDNFNFYINSDIKKADFWIVFEDLKNDIEYCEVPQENVIYLNNETSFKKDYFFEIHMIEFLNQFNYSYGCYPTLKKNHINTTPFIPWMIHANHGDTIFKKTELNYDFFSNLQKTEKKIELSVICSSKSHTENHKLRVEFLNILKNHFKDNLQWFGNGINEIENKFEVISNSKHHIVLENDSKYNLVSEKLYDSYLGLSFPIYYGAPNINDYFDINSLTMININDINGSISTIENVIKNNFYDKNLNLLNLEKEKVLNEYNMYNRICEIIKNKLQEPISDDVINKLHSSGYFWKKVTSQRKKIKRTLQRKMRLDF